jgi:hypothetical protein
MRIAPLLSLAVSLFVVSCGRTVSAVDADPAAADASVETPADASTEASADSSTFEMKGVYRCCAEGIGTDCCPGAPPQTCFKHGGIYGACRQAGELYEGKVICAGCCDGLERSSLLVPGNAIPPEKDLLPDGCDYAAAPPSMLVCIKCGDGICGVAENFCNCPIDCPRS